MALRILVVEDDETVRNLLQRNLTELGFETETAVDAQTAIDLLQMENFHAVITDKNMPGILHSSEGGMDVLEFLHQNKPDTAALMITAYATVETAVEAMKLGAFDYITKPFSKKDLGEKLHRILEYQQCIDPASAFNLYRGIQEEMLALIKKSRHASIDEQRFEDVLSSFQEKLDYLFQQSRYREKLLLAQRDSMANMAAWACELKEVLATGEVSAAEDLTDRIINEGNQRL